MKTKTTAQLKKEADKYFSLYVRYRDSKLTPNGWFTECITCGRWLPIKQMQAGHFQSRRFSITRFDEENVNGQCQGCNIFRYGEQYKYAIALDLKYGDGTAHKLAAKAKLVHHLKPTELQAIIANAKTEIEQYEQQSSYE